MIKGQEHLSCEERLRELDLFRLEKRSLQGNLTAALQYVNGAYKQERNQLLTWSDSDSTRGNGCELKEGGFRLGVRKKFFTHRVLRCWHKRWLANLLMAV